MRLFTAVGLEPRVRDAVAAAFAHLRTDPAYGSAAVKWVAPSNLHLTLQFLGEVSPRAASVLVNAFASKLSHSPFHVSFGPGETFPSRGQPRVICMGVQEGAVQLASVRREVQTRLTPLGYPAGDKVFRPHLTVGRVRRGVSTRRVSLVEALATVEVPSARALVDRVSLFESRLKAGGPSYHLLGEMLLGGPASEDPATVTAPSRACGTARS
jgi:2'-5' RNA ligase